jgi:hypothetical protein
MPKRFLIPLVATAAVALTSLGLIVWIAANPQYWFPGAYRNTSSEQVASLERRNDRLAQRVATLNERFRTPNPAWAPDATVANLAQTLVQWCAGYALASDPQLNGASDVRELAKVLRIACQQNHLER